MLHTSRTLRVLPALLAALLLGSVTCYAARAEEAPESRIPRPDPNALTILYEVESQPLPDIAFSLFQVAETGEDGTAQWKEPCGDYNLNLSPTAEVAAALEDYLVRDGVEPDLTGKTDEEGLVTFEDLQPGLYLVTGESTTLDTDDEKTETVKPIATLVTIQAGSPSILEAKHDLVEETGEPVARRVIKVWKDASDGSKAYPVPVKVQLLKDGQVYDTQTLDEDNNWRFAWEKLDGDADWSVVEAAVPAGYTADVSQDGDTFVITNTREPDTGTPKEPDNPQPPDKSTPSKGPGLPQTGLDWIPVICLSAGGVVLCLTGLIVRIRENRRREDRW